MFRLLMPVRMVELTPPHTALVIEVEELTMHGGSPSRYYQRFQILVLIRHILRVYTEWCYTCRWLNPSQYPPTEGSDSVDIATQVVRLHVTTAKAVSGPSYCLISHKSISLHSQI